MKDTQTIALGGSVYTLESTAAERLAAYRAALKSHFEKSGDHDETVNDIELRIAERMTALIESGSTVITDSQMRDVLDAVGSLSELTEGVSSPHPTGDEPKRLRRDTRHAILGGVCAGIAAYFEVDPTVVRVVTVVLALVSGALPVIPVYLIMWLVVPAAEYDRAGVISSDTRPSGAWSAIILAAIAVPLILLVGLFMAYSFFGITSMQVGPDYATYIRQNHSDWVKFTSTDPSFSIMYPNAPADKNGVINLPNSDDGRARTMAIRTLAFDDPSLDADGCVVTDASVAKGAHYEIIGQSINGFCLTDVLEADGENTRITTFYTIPDVSKMVEVVFTYSSPMNLETYTSCHQSDSRICQERFSTEMNGEQLFLDILTTFEK